MTSAARPAPALAARVADLGPSAMRDLLRLTARPEILTFAGGLPAPEIFDVDGWREAFEAALAWPSAGVNLQYSTAEGLWSLRVQVAARLTRTGLPTEPEQVLVTTGSQQALSVLSTVLLDPGQTVLVEDPTYLSALQAFLLGGARAVAVEADGQGVRVDALADAVRRERPVALYLVPTFANPTGLTLPADRRREVARLVAEHGLWLVEDAPYSELRFAGEPVPPISADPALARHSIHLGTLSKIGCPGLRIGWMRAPEAIMESLSVVKQAADLHTSTLVQAAAAHYLAHADLDGHLDRVRAAYRQRRDAMLAAMPETMPAGTTWTRPDGGMFLWVTLPEGHDATALLARAMAQGVAYVPGAQFHAGRVEPRTLRMCYVTYEPTVIAEGMCRLAAAMRG